MVKLDQYVSGKLPTYPSSKFASVFLKWEVSDNVEGWVVSFPET